MLKFLKVITICCFVTGSVWAGSEGDPVISPSENVLRHFNNLLRPENNNADVKEFMVECLAEYTNALATGSLDKLNGPSAQMGFLITQYYYKNSYDYSKFAGTVLENISLDFTSITELLSEDVHSSIPAVKLLIAVRQQATESIKAYTFGHRSDAIRVSDDFLVNKFLIKVVHKLGSKSEKERNRALQMLSSPATIELLTKMKDSRFLLQGLSELATICDSRAEMLPIKIQLENRLDMARFVK